MNNIELNDKIMFKKVEKTNTSNPHPKNPVYLV